MNNIKNINNKNEALFFKVWNNNYLRNQILFRIKDIPVRCSDNYNNKNGWPYSILGRRNNYNSIISLEWMLINNQYEMIKDKCKSNKFIQITQTSIQHLITNCRNEEIHKLIYYQIKKNKENMVQIDLIKESVLLDSVYSLDIYIKLYKQDGNYEIISNWEYSDFNSVNSSLMVLALSNCNLKVGNYLLGINNLKWFNESELIDKIIEKGIEISGSRSTDPTNVQTDNNEIKDNEIKKHLKEIQVEKTKHNNKLSYTVPDQFTDNYKSHTQSLNDIFTKLLCKSYTPLDTENTDQPSTSGSNGEISNFEKKKKYKKTLDFIYKNLNIQIEKQFFNAFKKCFSDIKRMKIIKIAIEVGYYFQDITKFISSTSDWYVIYHFNQNKFNQLSTMFSSSESYNQTLYSFVFSNFEIEALPILIKKLKSYQNFNSTNNNYNRITSVKNDLYVGEKLPNKSNDQVLVFFNELIQMIYYNEISVFGITLSVPWEFMFGNLIKNYPYELLVLLIDKLPLFKSKFINWINQDSPTFLTYIFWSPSNQTGILDISFIDLLYKYYKFTNSSGGCSFSIPKFSKKQLNENKVLLVNHLVGNYQDKLFIPLMKLLPNIFQNSTLVQSIKYYSLLNIGNINSILLKEHVSKPLTVKTIENYLFEDILLNQLFNGQTSGNGILNSIISTVKGYSQITIPVFNNPIKTIDYLYSNKLLSKFGNRLAVSIFEKLVSTFIWDRKIDQVLKEQEIILLIGKIFTLEQLQDKDSLLVNNLLSISLEKELFTIFKFILNNHLQLHLKAFSSDDIFQLLNEYYYKKYQCRNQYIEELEDGILNNQFQKNCTIKLLLLGEIINLVSFFKQDTTNQVNELFNYNGDPTFILILNLINQYYNLDSFKLIFSNILLQFFTVNGSSTTINRQLLIDAAVEHNRLDIIIYYIESNIITTPQDYISLKSSFLLKFPKSLFKQITSTESKTAPSESIKVIKPTPYDRFPIFKFSCLLLFITYMLKLCYDKYAPFTTIHFFYLLLFISFSKYLLNKI